MTNDIPADQKRHAKRTIESNLISGLAATAHLSHLNISQADFMVPALMDALFAPHGRWAIRAYLDQVEGGDATQEA